MSTENHVSLRREVEKIFGRRVAAYADVIELIEEISRKTGFRISINTVRRFFGIIQAVYPPSGSTLEIFARYAGFRSFEHFQQSQSQQQNGTQHTAQMFLEYASILFEKAALNTDIDPAWTKIVRETILYLENSPHLYDQFQQSVAKTTVGQSIYFEQFVNLDRLNSYYGDGLRYYMAAKPAKEAQIFGQSLLCLRSFLTGDTAGLENHYQMLVQHKPDRHMHPFIYGRYYAAQFLYHRDNTKKIFELATEARRTFSQLPPSREAYYSFPCFELVVADALILTGQVLEALFYIQESKKKKTAYVPPSIDIKLFTALDLYEAIVYIKIGETEKAKRILNNLRPSDFYFLSRRYYTALFLIAKSIAGSRKISTPEQEQLEDLLSETGFSTLRQLSENTFLDKNGQREAIGFC